jgi:non-ribosomal peptide synthetase component F
VTHSNILNLTSWYHREYDVRHLDNATQMVGAGFDVVGIELWPFLTAGACLHVCPEDVKILPPVLLDWLAERDINHSFLPTPIVELCLELEWPKRLLDSLRVLMTGGDKLHTGPKVDMPFRFDNVYAPAECTVMALYHPVQTMEHSPPLGRPVWNTRHFIVDERLQPLPLGIPGELLIAGLGISRGYLNRPQMNKEKFIDDHLSAPETCLEGARGRTPIYKSGDLTRFRPDGSIVVRCGEVWCGVVR